MGVRQTPLSGSTIWIDHLRSTNKEMRKRLNQGHVVIHPLIIAELALGSLRTETLALLDLLAQVRVAQLGELRFVRFVIEALVCTVSASV
jgi:predicted nucleic acid-binding protein